MAHENRILTDTGDGHWGRKQSTACNPTEMKHVYFSFQCSFAYCCPLFRGKKNDYNETENLIK